MSDISPSKVPPAGPELQLAPPVAAVPPEKIAARKRLEVRIWCAFVFLMCSGMLGVGRWLNADPSGAGTHQQMGFPPCGMLATTGIPCPTCGCTTAVTHLAHGHVIMSFLTQPFGFAVGALALILLPLTLIGVVTGIWKGPSMFVLGWYWRYWTYGGLALLLGAWVYKIILVQMHIAL